MIQGPGYTVRVILACMKKDIKSALSERIFTILGVVIPVNFMVLMSLFVLAGSNAPTAVVMNDHGIYAQQFYASMSNAHSFRLQQASAQEANDLFQSGQIVAIVTIPADFTTRVQQRVPVKVGVEVNNLNTDFTNDIRRAVPLSITSFYAKAFPQVVTITTHERDFYPQDTDYIPYLTVSILVLGLSVSGMLQAGTSTAREWENETVKELLLSPASREAIIIGKMLGALVMSLASIVVVLAALVFVIGVHPAHWGAVIGFTLLSLVIFLGAGALLGVITKLRLPVTALAVGLSVPLFFLSGSFGPLSLNTPVIQVIAQSTPVYYSIVLQQYAFHNFTLNPYGTGINALILCGFGIFFILLASIVLRRSRVAH